MAVVRTSIFIQRPQQEVFDTLADLKRHPEWDASLLKVEILDEPPFREGMRGLETRKMMGREMKTPYVITHSDPPRGYGFRVTEGPVKLEATMRCEEEAGGTRVSYEYTLGGLMAPIMARNVRKANLSNLANLKRILETPSA